MSKYHIRYNTKHAESNLVWRIFEDGVEHLVEGFQVNVPVFSESTIEHGIQKWNVACEGIMRIEKGIAYIEPL